VPPARGAKNSSSASPAGHWALVPAQIYSQGHIATSKVPSGRPASPASGGVVKSFAQQIEDLLLATPVSASFGAGLCFTRITLIWLLVWVCRASELPVPQKLASQTLTCALTLVCNYMSGQNRVACLGCKLSVCQTLVLPVLGSCTAAGYVGYRIT